MGDSGKRFVLRKSEGMGNRKGATMKKFLLVSVFGALALIGCGEGDPYDSTVQMEDGKSRNKLAVDQTVFVQAKDGTLYSIDCLRENGAKIAAGQKDAGRECAADRLSETRARGLHKRYGRQAYFYYVNPLNYYGGNSSSTTSFCSAYFGVAWGGCFSWLGYSPSAYQTSSYYPECSTCVTTQVGATSTGHGNPYGGIGASNSIYPTTTGCPNYCRYVQNWTSQPFYHDWSQANWFALYY